MAEVAVPRHLFADILRLIEELRPPPVTSTGKCVRLCHAFHKKRGDLRLPNAKQNIGVDTRTLKDSTGKAFGAELYAGYQKPEGEITEVSYMFPRPGADKTPVQKVSLVTRASDDLGCGVGYYK